MKKQIYFITSLILVVLLSASLYAAGSYSFSGSSDINFNTVKGADEKEYTKISLKGFTNAGNPGEPELPVAYIKLYIPSDQTVTKARIVSSSQKEYTPYHLIYPAQQDIPTTDIEITVPFSEPNSNIYDNDQPFPQKIINVLDHDWFDGDKHIVTLAVNPIRYFPKENKIILYTDIQYELEFASGAKGAIHVQPRSEGNAVIYNELLKGIVYNPQEVPEPASSAALEKVSSGPLPFYEYVIITPNAFKASFSRLLDWKKRKGLDAGIVTVEDILANYSTDFTSGITDHAGAIRQYLQDGYVSGTTVYALLGGDYNYVPIRYGWGMINSNSDDYIIPADLYFSDFNGDWNIDADGRYGEPAGSSGDSPDYGPEIFVGRLLCSSTEDIERWTDKLILYEQDPGRGNSSYIVNSFMIESDQLQSNSEAEYVKSHLPAALNTATEIWKEHPSYNSDPTNSPYASEVIDNFNDIKYGLFSWFGHGAPIKIVCKSKNINQYPKSCIFTQESMDSESGNGLDNLNNYNYPAIVYSIACENTPFDDYVISTYPGRNLGEGFTVMYNGGGPAFLGNTRYGYVSSSYLLYSDFADKLSAGGSYLHIGIAEAIVRNSSRHYLSYSHNLVGCPETMIWTEIPAQFTSASVTDNGSSLAVNAGVSGCDITVMSTDGGVSYQLCAHNVSSYTFTTSIRPLYVTITKANHLPFVGITGGTITEDLTFYGKIEILDDLTISNNKTLILDAGSAIVIEPNASITVNSGSKIEAIGTESNPISFRRSSSSAWDRIQLNGGGNQFEWCTFDGGTYNVDIRSRDNTFSHCTFKNASRGLNAYKRSDNSWSSFKLDNCMVENNNYGVVAYQTYAGITNCTIRNNTSYGLGLNNSRIGNNYSSGTLGGYFTNNHIYNNGLYGVNISNNGKLWLGYSSTQGHNKIENNASHEIYIASSETARLYEASTGGYGAIYDDEGYFIYNLGKTWQNEQYVLVEVSAENNYWGGTWTGSDGENYTGPVAAQFYGPVDYTPYLSSDPTGISGASGYPSRIIPGDSDDEIVNPDKRVFVSLPSVSGILKSTGNSDDLSVKLQTLEEEIKSDPNNPNNAAKLNEMFNLEIDEDPGDKTSHHSSTMNMLADYRNSLMELDEKSASSNPDSAEAVRINGETSMVLEMYDSNNLANYKQTLELADKYDSYIKNSDSRREFLSLKLTAYEFTNQYEQALKILDELKAEVKFDYKYYTAPTYEVIEQNLDEQLGKPYLTKTDASTAEYEDEFLSSTPEKFALYNNYPNPFNPLTSIPFSLIKDSHVTLDVFNVLGQKVASLSDKNYQAGNHLVKFNAQGFSSGIYFVVAHIKTLDSPSSNYVFNHKMILLK